MQVHHHSIKFKHVNHKSTMSSHVFASFGLIFVLSFLCSPCDTNLATIHLNSKHHQHHHYEQQQGIMSTQSVITDRPTYPPSTTTMTSPLSEEKNRDIVIGPCRWVIGRSCPDNDIQFFLYTRRNLMDRQYLHIDTTLAKSNLTGSHFNPRHPTKIIVHGYNADMFLHPLHKMREEYLARDEYNVIYVEWSILSPGPCYLSAVHNTKHVGACVAQLVERILDSGSADIHLIGFSLGAQLANYVARNLGSFLLPRITGLDPALPLFITSGRDDKLDASDAEYVDVIHTNALVQGKLEKCGHVDFYMNGGIMQPGCYSQGSNPFACAHQRAPDYFLESIRSPKGFWGWSCSSYIAYLVGMCPPTNYLMEAGENIKRSTRGMYFANTNDTSPYALGKWTDLPTLGTRRRRPQNNHAPPTITLQPPSSRNTDPLMRQVDTWAKLEAPFNNVAFLEPTTYEQNPLGDNWTYFSDGSTSNNNGESDEFDVILPPYDSVEGIGGPRLPSRTGNEVNISWQDYRRNLTHGWMDNEIFQVPQIGEQ